MTATASARKAQETSGTREELTGRYRAVRDFTEALCRTQHQELLVTDLKYLFSLNPLRPAYVTDGTSGLEDLPSPNSRPHEPAESPCRGSRWLSVAGGIHDVGYGGTGFCFDNETPRHRAL